MQELYALSHIAGLSEHLIEPISDWTALYKQLGFAHLIPSYPL